MVKAWKSTNCMKGLNWTKIRLSFLSTTVKSLLPHFRRTFKKYKCICRSFVTAGEASDVDNVLWLSSRAYYKPIIEVCGGTELASSYLQGTLLQPQAFGALSTASMATGVVILNDNGVPYVRTFFWQVNNFKDFHDKNNGTYPMNVQIFYLFGLVCITAR